ncbi:MAG: hypothetical protein GX802_05120, partial [Clostridiales bacterium]|nr:hypothetical protein [Clostridiales bacterium]
MQIGVLALVCLGILTITGVSERFEKRFSISRFGLFMLCFSAIILNTLSVKVVPEFVLNPASLFLIFVMLLGSFERGEKGFSVALFAIILIAAAQVALSLYVGGEFWGLIG